MLSFRGIVSLLSHILEGVDAIFNVTAVAHTVTRPMPREGLNAERSVLGVLDAPFFYTLVSVKRLDNGNYASRPLGTTMTHIII